MGIVGENIKKFRTFRGIKQQELADALHKSKSVISNWERGENSPDIELTPQICKILKVTPDELFGFAENMEYRKHKEQMERYQKEIDVLRAQAENINRQIENLERLRYQEENPLLDCED